MEHKKAKSLIFNGDKPSNNSDDAVSPQTVALIDHLIMDEILPRLPVKSLIRCKLVSKKWKSTISTLQFAKLHLKFSSSTRRHFLMFTEEFHKCDSFCLLPYRERSNVKDLVDLPGGLGYVDWYELADSSNGVVCLYQRNDGEDERGCYFTLWNPATREEQDIATPKGVHVSEAYGFGYVESIDDYIIVASFGSGTNLFNKFRGLYMYSLKEGEWERVFGSYGYVQIQRWCWKWRTVRDKSNEELIAKQLQHKGVLVGDIMYWGDDFWTRRKIVGFNVVSNELRKYLTLDWQSEYDSLKLLRVKGCLSLQGKKKNGVSDFWILKNADDWSSWQKFFSVDLTSISLITLSETGKCLVRQSDEFKLVEPCKGGLDCCKGNDDVNYSHMVITRDHVESLFSPFGTTNDETDHKEDTDEKEDSGVEEDNTGCSEHLSTNNMLLENKRLSLSVEVENNTGTEKSDFSGDSDDTYNGDKSDVEDDDEDLDDDAEVYSQWETSDDEKDYETSCSDSDFDDDDDDDDDNDDDDDDDDGYDYNDYDDDN